MTLGPAVLCVGGCPGRHRTVSVIPGLHPPNASSSPSALTTGNVSSCCQCPFREEVTQSLSPALKPQAGTSLQVRCQCQGWLSLLSPLWSFLPAHGTGCLHWPVLRCNCGRQEWSGPSPCMAESPGVGEWARFPLVLQTAAPSALERKQAWGQRGRSDEGSGSLGLSVPLAQGPCPPTLGLALPPHRNGLALFPEGAKELLPCPVTPHPLHPSNLDLSFPKEETVPSGGLCWGSERPCAHHPHPRSHPPQAGPGSPLWGE